MQKGNFLYATGPWPKKQYKRRGSSVSQPRNGTSGWVPARDHIVPYPTERVEENSLADTAQDCEPRWRRVA